MQDLAPLERLKFNFNYGFKKCKMIIALKLIAGVVVVPAVLAFFAFLVLRSKGAKLNKEQTKQRHKDAMNEFMKLIPNRKH